MISALHTVGNVQQCTQVQDRSLIFFNYLFIYFTVQVQLHVHITEKAHADARFQIDTLSSDSDWLIFNEHQFESKHLKTLLNYL